MSTIGRNDPCSCGSGKKYKKCCLLGELDSASKSSDFIWRKLRKTDDKLLSKIFGYFLNHHSDILDTAWEEFYAFSHDCPELDTGSEAFSYAFTYWAIYNWIPDHKDENIDTEASFPIAKHYLRTHSHSLTNLEKDFIVASIKTNYSYYEILSLDRGVSMTVKDVLRNLEFVVHEKSGSESVRLGYFLLARVISMPGCNLFCGCYPFNLPEKFKINAIGMKQYYRHGHWQDKDLWDIDIEIRELFLDKIAEWYQDGDITVSNTDGEEIHPSKVFFDLRCSCETAVEKLLTLHAPLSDRKEIFKDSVICDETGKTAQINLLWVTDHANTLRQITFANIEVNKNQLVIEVNSEERAEKVQHEICNFMGELVSYQTTEAVPIDPDGENILYDQSKKDSLHENVKANAVLQEIHNHHWDNWLHTNIPALGNKTPKEAAKTEDGKLDLEVLLTDFDKRNIEIKKSDFPQLTIDIDFLRKELEMA